MSGRFAWSSPFILLALFAAGLFGSTDGFASSCPTDKELQEAREAAEAETEAAFDPDPSPYSEVEYQGIRVPLRVNPDPNNPFEMEVWNGMSLEQREIFLRTKAAMMKVLVKAVIGPAKMRLGFHLNNWIRKKRGLSCLPEPPPIKKLSPSLMELLDLLSEKLWIPMESMSVPIDEGIIESQLHVQLRAGVGLGRFVRWTVSKLGMGVLMPPSQNTRAPYTFLGFGLSIGWDRKNKALVLSFLTDRSRGRAEVYTYLFHLLYADIGFALNRRVEPSATTKTATLPWFLRVLGLPSDLSYSVDEGLMISSSGPVEIVAMQGQLSGMYQMGMSAEALAAGAAATVATSIVADLELLSRAALATFVGTSVVANGAIGTLQFYEAELRREIYSVKWKLPVKGCATLLGKPNR